MKQLFNQRRFYLPLCLLLLPLALSSCATQPCAQVVATSAPLPPLPAPLMLPPPKPLLTAPQIQSRLFVSGTPPMPASASSTLK